MLNLAGHWRKHHLVGGFGNQLISGHEVRFLLLQNGSIHHRVYEFFSCDPMIGASSLVPPCGIKELVNLAAGPFMKALLGLEIEKGIGCSSGKFFHLAPAVTQFEPQLF